FAQKNPVGIFQYNNNVGNSIKAGAVSYNKNTQTYTMKASEYNIGDQDNQSRYLYNKLEGDFILTANFKFEGDKEVDQKIGWMVRTSETDDGVMVSAFLHENGLTVGKWRELNGAETKSSERVISAAKRFYQILQLERRGHVFIFRAAHPGEPLQEIGIKELKSMPEAVVAGIAIASQAEEKGAAA